MSDESDGPYRCPMPRDISSKNYNRFPDVGSLIAQPDNMTVQAAMDLGQMDCDVIRDDARQDATECKPGPRDGNRIDAGRQYNIRAHQKWSRRAKVPRGTSEEKETGDD